MNNAKKYNIKKFKNICTLVLLLVLPMYFCCFNPLICKANQQEKIGITKATKKKGWDAPWMQDITFSVESKKIKIQDTYITEKHLIPTTDLLTVLELYSVKEKTELTTDTYICHVKNLHAYEHNGQKFCYKAMLEPVALSANGGIKESYGFVFIVYYYDDDGDGIFETLEFDAKEPRLAKYIESQTKK